MKKNDVLEFLYKFVEDEKVSIESFADEDSQFYKGGMSVIEQLQNALSDLDDLLNGG